ncbi:F0F1 ATP synthase subunit delta [Arthrobacter agilis]|uniref:F0F1 ATP synthase subunit delta n=1 Tax=Arthrobacter agilis TaxID=37921 RepID=UPI000B35CE3A|nr:F0F1 ATP synthase subunit delta [Arthrobacter agilis]OUM44097.1 F0F1 ATP synthase subunit delta [Arthrobacter agilis]PPB46472.1 F0F1 ATP synthase subunit delta [Arthrobacter agilis]TPV23873.1 F0F1 ATP synthase subunit delta [Arthrobacter agilis]VDR32616.1 F-type ATPase subunit delta [Arthrobacter agilis]
MAGVSSVSLASVREGLESRLPGADLALAEDLFGVLAILDSNAGLRRALTDPSRSGQDKAVLAGQLIGGRVSSEAADVVRDLVSERWANARDIGDALETLAATVVISVAEQGSGAEGLEQLENELYAFVQVVASNHALQRALSETQATPESKVALGLKLVPGAGPAARLLISQAIESPRGLKPAALVERFLELVAARQQRWIADVSVTRPLTADQFERLQSGLNGLYGRELKVNVKVDPTLIGGVRVSVGDEMVDSTVVTRLSELRRTLAG